MGLDWQNIAATGAAAFAGGGASYFVAAFYQSIDRKRRRVEDFEREWHAEDMRRSKDVLYPVLANLVPATISELESQLKGDVRHIERVLESLRRMAVCWRDDEVHRHYFLRLLGYDVKKWQSMFNAISVPDNNYWKPYFREIAAARFD